MNGNNQSNWEERFSEVNRKLSELSEFRVLPGDIDLAELEGKLLEELDELEYEDGIQYFRQRSGHSRES